jgi:CRISPR system Cascade subunit CasB
MTNSPPEQSASPLVAHLRDIATRDDRAALAALRRGLGATPGSAAEMHPFVAPFLPSGPWHWGHDCYYITAALFALHPEPRGQGNMGRTMRLVSEQAGGGSIEQRFVALLKCHRDDLFDHLRHAVSLAKSKEVPVCWDQLFRDIKNWDSDQQWVQRNWARSFWGAAPADKDSETDTTVETLAKGEQA